MKLVRVYPNQHPWLNGEVHAALQARNAAFRAGDMGTTRAHLQRTIRQAKREYAAKLEDQFNSGDVRSTWQGLQNITNYRGRTRNMGNPPASLPNELNTFFTRFEMMTTDTAQPAPPPPQDACPLSISVHDVRRAFKGLNIRKASGPDNIPGRVLKVCADQLADMYTDIFNLSLSQGVVPDSFKMSIIVPVPKQPKVTGLNDWRPVALTSIACKCFEKLVREYICAMLPPTLDPWQFAYRKNRSTDDAIALALHSALKHLEPNNKESRCVRMLFVDYSSAFNTILPARLDAKLQVLGVHPSLCTWIMSFLTNRGQVVRMGEMTSDLLTLSTGAPQGCVLSPLLYCLYTHDCEAKLSSNTIIKYADDTTVMGMIVNDDDAAYREEINQLAQRCQEDNLTLNAKKTKELIVDFRLPRREHAPIYIDGVAVERVSEFKFLGVNITEDLKWSTHTTTVTKKAQQRLHCLRQLKKFSVSPSILRSFYNSTVESVLLYCCTAWYGSCTALDQKALQRVVKAAQRIIGVQLPSLQEQYEKRSTARAMKIFEDTFHPSNTLFKECRNPRPGKRFLSIKSSTNRMLNSFFPTAVRLLNKQ